MTPQDQKAICLKPFDDGHLLENVSSLVLALIVGLVLLGTVLGVGYVYVRYHLRKLLKTNEPLSEAEIAEGLIDFLTSTDGVTHPTPQDRRRAALVNIGTWLMRRQATQFYFNATVTVLGGLIGTATLFLLNEQNKKIDLQNEKITLQTDANITESVLLEGARRAALAADMSALFATLLRAPYENDGQKKPTCELGGPYDDCWTTKEDEIPSLFHLSANLKLQVTAFTQRAIPYRLAISKNANLDFDIPLREQMEFPNLSPERGQVFETLVLNNIYTGNFDFSFAQLTDVDLRGQNLTNARLYGADLRRAFLRNAVLNGAFLDSAELSEADLINAILIGVQLNDADLFRARLDNADLTEAELNGSNFLGAVFKDALLQNAKMEKANAEEANFVRTKLVGGIFGGTDFSHAYMKEADLSASYFGGVNFSGADLSQARLDDGNLEGSWAWIDMPPKGLTSSAKILLCGFYNRRHTGNLGVKPEECEN